MAGIPEGVINVLPGSGSVCGQAIADHPKVSTIQIGPRAFRHSVVIQCVSSAKVPIALPSSLPPSFHPCSPFLGIATVIKSLTPSGKTTDEDQRRTCKSAEVQLSRCVARRQSSKPRESSHMQRCGRVRLQAKKIFKKVLKFFFSKISRSTKIFFGRGHSPTIPQQLLKVSRRLAQPSVRS